MPIEIKHQYTDAVLRTVHAVSLRGANLYGANLTGADLSRADLYKADLSGANLRGANLRGANLTGAYLTGAFLRWADLSGATIDTDKLDRLLARATRLGGHEFFLFALQDGSLKIKAGCRWMTIDDYRAHVARCYPDTNQARETLDILNFFEARAR